MSLITAQDLRNTAVYWAPLSKDVYGKQTYSSPVEISCRWEETTEIVRLPDGQEKRSTTQVFTLTDLAEGGYLWKGVTTGLTSETIPQKNDQAFEILKWERIESLSDSDDVVRVAYL